MKHNIINNMRIDVDAEKVRSSVSVRQGDTNTRVIHFTLTKDGKIYDLSNVIIATVYIKKPDGNICYNDCVIAGNEVQYTITSQSINVCGACECEIQISFSDYSLITTPSFCIYVYSKKLDSNTIESKNEYNALTEQTALASTYCCAAQESMVLAEEAESACKGLESSAGEYAESALLSKNEANTFAVNAGEARKIAEQSAEICAEAKLSCEAYKNSTEASEQNALAAKISTTESTKVCTEAQIACESYKSSAATSERKAAVSEQSALKSESNAKKYKEDSQTIYENISSAGIVALGIKHENAFYGDLGQSAYEHGLIYGNPHKTTYDEVGADAAGAAQSSYENSVAYADQAIANLIHGAPDTLDTLKEIADAMLQNKSVVEALTDAIGVKASQAELDTHAGNDTIHITATERSNWNAYEARIALLEKLIARMGFPYSTEV